MEPLPAELELESHLWALEFQGFTRVESAIPPQLLERVQSAFHAIIAGATPGTLEFGGPLHKQRACVIAPDGVIEATQPYEHHPALLELLELPRPMAVLEALLSKRVSTLRHVHGPRVTHRHAEGGDSAKLFYSTNGHVLPPGVDCDLRWHACVPAMHAPRASRPSLLRLALAALLATPLLPPLPAPPGSRGSACSVTAISCGIPG